MPYIPRRNSSSSTYENEYSIPEVLDIMGAKNDKVAQEVLFGHGINQYKAYEVSELYKAYATTGATGMRDYFLAEKQREIDNEKAGGIFAMWFFGAIAVTIVFCVIWNAIANYEFRRKY